MWERSGSFREALFDWHKSPMSEPAGEDRIKICLQIFLTDDSAQASCGLLCLIRRRE